MTIRNPLWIALIALAPGCVEDSSINDGVPAPYHLQLALIDPADGTVLEPTTAADADAGTVPLYTWPVGHGSGPLLAITYWAERETAALPLTLRVDGAIVEAEPPLGDGTSEEDAWDWEEWALTGSEFEVPLPAIGTTHRTVRATVQPTSELGRGTITVVLGGASQTLEIDFPAVRIAIGEPQAAGFLPDQVVHGVCVVVDTDHGEVTLSGSSSRAAVQDPSTVPVVALGEADLPADCPADDGWTGYALFEWAADGDTDVLTARWVDPETLLEQSTALRVTGERFRGYTTEAEWTLLDRDEEWGETDTAQVEVTLSYAPVGGLVDEPAVGAALTFSVFPDEVFEQSAAFQTDWNGRATAVYQIPWCTTARVFIELEDGTRLDLADTYYYEPEPDYCSGG